ncbi:DUF3885 domain-containing protein [Chamaesiphon sp.]|uniref:DUF3885 domain-containing protein n=1 Tax=Chamaesiphon sp. TaxID=2814140 RepID=UPI00359398DD
MTCDRAIESNTYRARILQVFGEQALEHGLFYLHPYSLRVELSGDRPNIKMFLRAYERSKAIIDFSLGDLQTVTVCLNFYGNSTLVSKLSVFRSLRKCGINIPKTAEIWQNQEPPVFDEDGDFFRTFICFDIEFSQIDLFLWSTLANELGIRPRSNCSLYLFDLERQILFHLYEDRGMDIIGGNKALLKQIYIKFNNWLLDYDLPIMDNYFKFKPY